MAKVITAKKIGRQGTTPGNKVIFHVYGANETIRLSDMVFKFDFEGLTTPAINNVQFVPNRIETIMNMGDTNVIVEGKSYSAQQMWEMSALGGIPVDDADSIDITFTTPTNGNLIIELRGTTVQI